MNETVHEISPAMPPDAWPDPGELIAALRAAGAHRFDPVRLHYIEALARRASTQQGSVKRLLDARLAQALAALRERFERAQRDAGETVARCAGQYPRAAGDLQQLLAAGDFKEAARRAAALQAGDPATPLGALLRQLEQHAPEHTGVRLPESTGSRPELKTLRESRNTWSKLSVDRQLAKALEQIPKNAGPLNSHMLVLRSLALMRDISPDYLNRFMTYADTLLCLEQGGQDKAGKPEAPKKRPSARAAKSKAQ